jgi:hypothetical protein
MRNSISRAVVARLTGMIMLAAAVLPVASASAGTLHGGGFGGGFRGDGFGGFHSGFVGHPGFVGFHPGFRPGFVAFHPGFVGFHRRFFHPGFFVNGVWVNGWWGGYSNSGCWAYRPVYDSWGSFLGQAYVNLCQ